MLFFWSGRSLLLVSRSFFPVSALLGFGLFSVRSFGIGRLLWFRHLLFIYVMILAPRSYGFWITLMSVISCLRPSSIFFISLLCILLTMFSGGIGMLWLTQPRTRSSSLAYFHILCLGFLLLSHVQAVSGPFLCHATLSLFIHHFGGGVVLGRLLWILLVVYDFTHSLVLLSVFGNFVLLSAPCLSGLGWRAFCIRWFSFYFHGRLWCFFSGRLSFLFVFCASFFSLLTGLLHSFPTFSW